MGLGIRVNGLGGEPLGFFTDDLEESFRKMCDRAPDNSLRRGVMQYGDTMFNSFQLYRLIDELEALPANEMTPTIQRVLDSAYLARRKSGWIYITGD